MLSAILEKPLTMTTAMTSQVLVPMLRAGRT